MAHIHLRAKGGMNGVCGRDYPTTIQDQNAVTEDSSIITCTECIRWIDRQNKEAQIKERHGWKLVQITQTHVAICAGCQGPFMFGESAWLKQIAGKWVRFHEEHPPWL